MTTIKTQSAGDTGSAVQRIFRRDEMPAMTGYSIDHLYAMIEAGEFPRPIPLGKRAVGWLERDIAAWQAKRIAARDGQAAS